MLLGHDHAADAEGSRSGRPRFGRIRTVAISSLIILCGLAASGFLASEWRSSVLNTKQRAFQSSVADVRSVLESGLDDSLSQTHTLSAIATMEPNADASRLRQWYLQLKRRGAAPAGVASAVIKVVPAARLAAFLRSVGADPKSGVSSAQIIPGGSRPLYCLSEVSVGGSVGTNLYPPLLDYCAAVIPGFGKSPFPVLIHSAAATRSAVALPIPGTSLIAIGEAIYKRGLPLATAAERRAALTGMVGTSFLGATLVGPALHGRSWLKLILYHRNIGGPLQLIGSVGSTAAPANSALASLGGGWFVRVESSASPIQSANDEGITIMGVGALLTILLFVLYRVLARSRIRAWGLVGEKTGELEYRSLHDPLTDLPNRTLVLDRAEQMLARSRRVDVPISVLFMDIDGFKQINDRYGHQVGDEVLRQVAARLKAVLRENDTVGRLGGDEFVMLVDPIGLDVAPELIAERILGVLRQEIDLPGRSPISITASIGIATGLPAGGEVLMQDADLALHRAKELGKDGYAMFESEMQTAAQDRLHLEMDLAEALGRDEFFLVYQPMLDLASEQIVGVEALLRWRHPSAGEMPPDAFIPIAEDSALIVPIGHWVLEQACAQSVEWRRHGYRLNLSVNVSARQLERPEFAEEVSAVLRMSGVDPATLTLEITETALMREPDATAALLDELKALGLRIAVDDFGTGYSSLAYLRQFPVDSLKIDRTFITNVTRSSEAQALAHTLIQLGKALGLETLAEGVEDQSQVRALQLEGCDLAQGFLFARPLAPAALERYVREHPGTVAPVAAAAAALSPAR